MTNSANNNEVVEILNKVLLVWKEDYPKFDHDNPDNNADRMNEYFTRLDVARDEALRQIEDFYRNQILEARIDERNEVALDNYRGHTFSDSTNYEGKFAKFIANNENRLKDMTAQFKSRGDKS